MHGIKNMLSGKGEKINRAARKSFRGEIPNSFPSDWTVEQRAERHPAYSGPMANTSMAADYRRAHQMHGPQSKAEHAALAEYQRTHGMDANLIQAETPRRSVLAWLIELLVP